MCTTALLETSMPLTCVMQQQGLHSYFHNALYHLQGAEPWCGKWKRSSLAVETPDQKSLSHDFQKDWKVQ